MAKINYRQRMKAIDALAQQLENAVNDLRQDVAEEGADASVAIRLYDEFDSGECCIVVETTVTTTY